jgi:hypothetical protein
MNQPASPPMTEVQIDEFCQTVKGFNPGKASASWSPECGGKTIEALNKLAEVLEKKAKEIKLHIRTLTVEELNELDGFARSGANDNNQQLPLG